MMCYHGVHGCWSLSHKLFSVLYLVDCFYLSVFFVHAIPLLSSVYAFAALMFCLGVLVVPVWFSHFLQLVKSLVVLLLNLDLGIFL